MAPPKKLKSSGEFAAYDTNEHFSNYVETAGCALNFDTTDEATLSHLKLFGNIDRNRGKDVT